MNEKDSNEIIRSVSNIQKLRNETILITGSTGLIGFSLVEFLLYLNNNHNYKIKIIATGRNIKKMKNRFISHIDNQDLVLIELDLYEDMSDIFIQTKPTFIVHAASGADPESFKKTPVDIMKSNFLGCLNLLTESLNHQIKNFLYVSSGEVYGDLDQKFVPFEEKIVGTVDFNNIRACYPESKRASETLCHAFNKQYGQKITIARPSHIFGHAYTEKDSRVSAEFFRKSLCNEVIELKSPGTQFRSYTYISDCISGLLTILINGKSNEVYNVTNTDNALSLKDFAHKIANIGKVDFKVNYDKTKNTIPVMANASYSNDKLKEIGWKPQVGIDDGIYRVFCYLEGENKDE